MLRLAEPHGRPIGETTAPRGERPLNAISLIQSVRSLRADYFARQLRHRFEVLVRWAGLSNLFAACRKRIRKRRTLRALDGLDDRLLNDIGVQRADIEATATLCSEEKPAAGNSVWYGLAAWARREVRRRSALRELSALSDEILADIGIERSDIPVVAAALADERQAAAPEATRKTDSGRQAVPGPARVIAFTELRHSLRRSLAEDHDRSTAA